MTTVDTLETSPGPGVAASVTRTVALVVEDDEALRAEIAEVLRDDGHEVLEASDGRRALDLLRQGATVDLILLDLWLPNMDGWSFRAAQRADRGLREVPVVVLTADDSAQARAIDADAFIRKPFDGSRLCSTVRRVIGERRTRRDGQTELLTDTVYLLAGALSHEIANPLMALIGALESEREDEASPPPTSRRAHAVSAAELLDQCWRIAHALRTLRDLPFPRWTHESDIDLASVVRAATAWTSSERVRVAMDVDTPAHVRGDPIVALYVCTALVRNAIEAVPPRRPTAGDGDDDTVAPDVRVRLLHEGDEVVLEVADRGEAIPPDELADIFTVGYTGRERAWGTGLRLWFVRQAVEGLGGRIHVSNAPGGGVTCRVQLPRARGESPQV